MTHGYGTVASVYEGRHRVPVAGPRGEEEAARAFFVGVLGMTELVRPG